MCLYLHIIKLKSYPSGLCQPLLFLLPIFWKISIPIIYHVFCIFSINVIYFTPNVEFLNWLTHYIQRQRDLNFVSFSSVHERQMYISPPIRTPTPYGGRLTWRLPGGTKLIVHMKDKHKIRHKKRWSQVWHINIYYINFHYYFKLKKKYENTENQKMTDNTNKWKRNKNGLRKTTLKLKIEQQFYTVGMTST